jgi:6-pyruvoyltetrahydropterin/6-carboxytetrahydropterin synthase
MKPRRVEATLRVGGPRVNRHPIGSGALSGLRSGAETGLLAGGRSRRNNGRPFPARIARAVMRVTKEFTFDAAHNLPNYHGKCERLHGHTYRIQVTIEAPVDAQTGMALDFAILGDVVKEEVVDALDHRYINEIIPISSAENVAIWAWQRVSGRLQRARLHEIKLWETPNSFVTYHGD